MINYNQVINVSETMRDQVVACLAMDFKQERLNLSFK
jgi:hypothetical protein